MSINASQRGPWMPDGLLGLAGFMEDLEERHGGRNPEISRFMTSKEISSSKDG